MKKHLLPGLALLLACIISLAGFAQVPPPATQTPESQVYTFVEQPPQFPGGDQAMYKFLIDNIKYPESAVTEGKEGLVVISFVVNEDGSRSELQILKSQGDALDNEAKRVVAEMPAWVAGKQNGRLVRVRFTLPVRFSLKKETPQMPGPTITRGRAPVTAALLRMPEFTGGPGPMLVYLEQHLKYPKKARKAKIQGEVLVDFLVLENGQLTDIKVIESLEPTLDAEAVRVVKSMPAWQPGTRAGKPASVRYTLPVRFSLR